MSSSAVDPYEFLAATRILACVLMLPLLTLAADFCGVFFGWVTNTLPISSNHCDGKETTWNFSRSISKECTTDLLFVR